LPEIARSAARGALDPRDCELNRAGAPVIHESVERGTDRTAVYSTSSTSTTLAPLTSQAMPFHAFQDLALEEVIPYSVMSSCPQEPLDPQAVMACWIRCARVRLWLAADENKAVDAAVLLNDLRGPCGLAHVASRRRSDDTLSHQPAPRQKKPLAHHRVGRSLSQVAAGAFLCPAGLTGPT